MKAPRHSAPPAICTIVAANYIAHARALAHSFREHHPNGQVHVLVVDRDPGEVELEAEPFQAHHIADIGLSGFRDLALRSTVLELSTAVKAAFLRYLVTGQHLEKVCYFDPDIVVYRELDELARLLDHYRIVLTPHLLHPIDDERQPNELNILQSGAYNLGFIGVSAGDGLGAFLDWWHDRLMDGCVVDVERGLFVDQRWVDLVPGLFGSVHIARDPGYNVAYWNLSQRRIERRRDGYYVNGSADGSPLKFFHFSGFQPADVDRVSVHQDRFRLNDLSDESDLFLDYGTRLHRYGYDEISTQPYGYGAFEDGVAVPAVARQIWTEVAGMRDWPDPFSVGTGCFRDWLNEPAMGLDDAPIVTRLAKWIYEAREDLQAAFPDIKFDNRNEFVGWFTQTGSWEHSLPPVFLDPIRKSLNGRRSAYRAAIAAASRVRSLPHFAVTHVGKIPLLARLSFLLSPRQKARIAKVTSTMAVVKRASPTGRRRRSVTLESLPKGVNLVGYLRSDTGVGEVARGVLQALRTAGEPVSATSIGLNDPSAKGRRVDGNIPRDAIHDTNLLNVNADQLPVVAESLGRSFFLNRTTIGFAFWELETFPEEWVSYLEMLDEVWVASRFVQSALALRSPVAVVRIPPVVDVGNTTPTAEARRRARRKTVLCAFDALSVPERKNPFGVIEAFRRAFGKASEEARLVVKVSNLEAANDLGNQIGLAPGFASQLEREVEAVSGQLLDTTLDRVGMLSLIRDSDAYVSLHRSEGFGLILAEAMALGVPCIATSYSGNVDFMNPSNSFPVDYRLQTIERDCGPYKAGQRWAAPDIDHAAEQMRTIVDRPEDALQRADLGRQEIERSYAPAAVGRVIRERAEVLRARRGHPA